MCGFFATTSNRAKNCTKVLRYCLSLFSFINIKTVPRYYVSFLSIYPRLSIRNLFPRGSQLDGTTDKTTSHLTDKTTSHSTRLSKDDNQVAGYNPAKDAGQVIGYSQSTKPASGQVAGYAGDNARENREQARSYSEFKA